MLTSSTHSKEIGVADLALAMASSLCRNVHDRKAILKGDRTPVTIADYGSQAVICRILQEHFPGDPVMAEEDSSLLQTSLSPELQQELVKQINLIHPCTTLESAMEWIDRGNTKTYSDRFWTLDPVDGTKGFLRGDHYAIALALIEDGEVVVSGVSCPKMDPDNCMAAKGCGAELNHRPLQASALRTFSSMRVCQGVESSHSAHGDAQRVADHLGIGSLRIKIDSQAKYTVVARGDAEIYLRLPTRKDYVERIWDHAAGALLVTEAGGKVTDCRGNELDFSCGQGLENNYGIVATNGRVHDEIIDALKALNIGQSRD